MTTTTIPPEVTTYVESLMENYEYSDNIRIYKEGDHDGHEAYLASRKRGCCGFVDYQRFHYQGVDYIFGFNYGH